MTTPKNNGLSRALVPIATTLFGALISATLFMLNAFCNDVEACNKATRNHGERIAVLETHYGNIDEKLDSIARRLDSMQGKK